MAKRFGARSEVRKACVLAKIVSAVSLAGWTGYASVSGQTKVRTKRGTLSHPLAGRLILRGHHDTYLSTSANEMQDGIILFAPVKNDLELKNTVRVTRE